MVLPAYNEGATIESVIREHAAVLTRMKDRIPTWEIVCVDDGSEDDTGLRLDHLAQELPQLRVVHQRNQGIFGAVSRAYREARGGSIYSTASDGQWPAENLEAMYVAFSAGADLVIGVRTNRREVYTLWRRVISFFFNLMPRIVFGVVLADAGSIKLGKRAVFEFELLSQSPFFEAERIIRTHRSGLKIGCVPIQFLPRAAGKEKGASLRNILGSLRDLLICFRAYGGQRAARVN